MGEATVPSFPLVTGLGANLIFRYSSKTGHKSTQQRVTLPEHVMGQIPIETQHEQADPDEVLSELKAVERSCFFARQGGQRAILCYTLEQRVAGPGPGQFTERAIRVAACRRKAVYDRSQDPIVKISVERMRKKPHPFYETQEGRVKRLNFTVEKGANAPEVHRRGDVVSPGQLGVTCIIRHFLTTSGVQMSADRWSRKPLQLFFSRSIREKLFSLCFKASNIG